MLTLELAYGVVPADARSFMGRNLEMPLAAGTFLRVAFGTPRGNLAYGRVASL